MTAKTNATRQKEKRAKAKAVADRLGIVSRTWPVPKGIDDKLKLLMERHGFDDWRELIETAIQRLAEASPDDAGRFLTVTRHKITISAKVSRQLSQFVPEPEDE